MRRRALVGLVALAAVTALSPAAHASITPSASTSTATPLAAGATGPLDLDLKFGNSTGANGVGVGDTPKALTINLPPGFLASASIDGGACLQTANITDDGPCQIGSGVIQGDLDGYIPITGGTSVNFFLVPPPSTGDLAGLAVASGGTQVGTTAPITIRPSGDPDGVGVTIALTLPNSQSGVPLDITEIDSTFNPLRFPATCPSVPEAISVSATSYNDATVKSASLPLAVTGCGTLPYDPQFSATVTRDKSDNVATVATTFTQAASESPNSSVQLALPLAQLKPALGGLAGLCSNPSSGTCTPVASATASSPDYPRALTGEGYLTGSLSGLSLTLVFPPPFPLTLVGTVNLRTNVTAFTGLPDIPLTNLTVTLAGGSKGLFTGNCGDPMGTARAIVTDQNGDKKASVSDAFTIGGCPSTSSSGGSTPSPGSTSGSSPAAKAHLTSTRIGGLKTGRPSLRFTVSAATGSKLRSLTVTAPKGLSFVKPGAKLSGVTIAGARLKSATLSHGRLVLALRSAAGKLTVSVAGKALHESAALEKAAAAKPKPKRRSLKLTVSAETTKGKTTTFHVTVKNLGL